MCFGWLESPCTKFRASTFPQPFLGSVASKYSEGDEAGGSLSTFMQCLEEFADTESSIAIPEAEVEHMVRRFGTRVNANGTNCGRRCGDLVIPILFRARAAAQLESHELVCALDKLKNGELSNWLHAYPASILIQRT